MSWSQILRSHAAALLRDLAAELEPPAAEPDESFPVAYVIEPPWESPHLYEHATCRNCGRAIICSADGAAWRRVWVHADEPDLGFHRGCRAASFREGEWDDSLARGLTAESAPGTIRARSAPSPQ